MKHQLIRTDQTFPPAGYEFHDRITGKRYTDTHTPFASRVKEIIRDRQANARLFTDPKAVDELYVSKELSEYTCARLNNNPKFCTDGVTPSQPQSFLAPKFKRLEEKVCPNCGGKLKEIFCKTCTARRITGYECLTCNTKVAL